MALGSEVSVETHPGVGGGDSGECGRPHKSARSLQARTTPNWFPNWFQLPPTGFVKGTQSQSYLYRIVRVYFGSVTMSYG